MAGRHLLGWMKLLIAPGPMSFWDPEYFPLRSSPVNRGASRHEHYTLWFDRSQQIFKGEIEEVGMRLILCEAHKFSSTMQ
jgi:hypothetical protein